MIAQGELGGFRSENPVVIAIENPARTRREPTPCPSREGSAGREVCVRSPPGRGQGWVRSRKQSGQRRVFARVNDLRRAQPFQFRQQCRLVFQFTGSEIARGQVNERESEN